MRMPSTTSGDKRIVLEITRGRCAGMSMIVGAVAAEAAGTLETYLPPGDGSVESSLIRVKPRYLVYRQYRPELTGIKGHHEGDTPRMSPSQR